MAKPIAIRNQGTSTPRLTEYPEVQGNSLIVYGVRTSTSSSLLERERAYIQEWDDMCRSCMSARSFSKREDEVLVRTP